MGKGDKYRPVDKDKYERNYLRVFGIKCPSCNGSGFRDSGIGSLDSCCNCNGIGYIERKK
jgi:DnaJ-class molecular chaperone